MRLRSRLSIVLFAFLLLGCQKEEPAPYPDIKESILVIPEGFPEPVFPDDNQFTESRWELGKKLFYDPVMSRDNTVSCADCHKPSLAFSDNVALSKGVDEALGTRNAPSLANVAYHPYFTREGGVPSLEMQVLVPIQEHNEFDFNILEIADRLSQDPEYVRMSREAYNRTPNHFVITRALATFERSLISGNSPYDRYVYQGDRFALNQAQRKGMELFFSDRTRCASCHSGFNFTDYTFRNNGLYTAYADIGRFRLTGDERDRALFKVPSLRNVEFTAPYMHDGSMNTLEEVIDHYNSGGKGHPHRDERIRPLNLTDEEKANLVAFLKSLSDQEFINDEKFRK